ncbi:hypothetical protein P8452_61222 [Trifolium repens]|nr:hypothetical protein P8452_61222 [Trifolium repens]
MEKRGIVNTEQHIIRPDSSLDGDRKKKLPLKRPFLRPKVLALSTDARVRSYQSMLKRRANSSFCSIR